MLDKFIEYLESMVGNSLYVWGAQGESVKSIVKDWVIKKETSTKNTNRVLSLLDKKIKDDFYFYDCSGLGVNWLLKNKLITSDMTANTMYKLCSPISKSEVKKGDWCFIKNSKGIMTHIGYVVDSNLNVIESAGRDLGVIKGSISKGSPNGAWSCFGRPIKLFPDLNGNSDDKKEEVYMFTRILKNTSPRMRGEDVSILQRAIGVNDDGVFGNDTENKLKTKQKELGLIADGKAGKNTITALGFKWR